MPTDFAKSIPVLASLNIDESLAYYVNTLGFSGERFGDYLIVKRDELEIHFWLTNDKIFPENTSCYIRGGQVSDLYEEFKAAGVERLSDFAVRPWNMKEFHIIDPHGNLLKFGCIPK